MRFLEWSSLRNVSLPWLSEITVVKNSRLLRIVILSMSRKGRGGKYFLVSGTSSFVFSPPVLYGSIGNGTELSFLHAFWKIQLPNRLFSL
jgi:hypothetical protein